MKKVLSALLAMLMVVSCMAGITFSVAAEGTETIALYKGETTSSQFGGDSPVGNSIGQVLTIPEGKVLVSIAYPITYTYIGGTHPGTINVWQWNGAKGALLYTGGFSFGDNARDSVITINNPEIANITGTIYYEIAYNDSSIRLAVGGSTEGPADGVTNYYNGAANEGKGFWDCNDSKYGIGSTITVQDAAEEAITSMKLAGEACGTQYNWEIATTEIGQRFTVPTGNVLTGYTIGQLHDYKGSNNTGRLDIYQWASNYAISTAAEPLFSMEFAGYNGKALEAVIPADKKIGGEVIAVITYLSGDGAGWKPQGGSEAVSGVTHYADGLAYAGSTNAKGIYSWINWTEGEPVINASEYNKVPLYTGASNTGGQFTTGAYGGAAKQTVGQKFTLDGEVLACISFDMIRTYDDVVANNRGVLKVYVWDTDYATTVASTPRYSVEFANHRNNNARAFAIPTELGLTGTLYWEIECLEASSNMKHGYVPGTGAAKAGVESFRNGAAISGVWSGEKNIGCDVFTLDMEETSYPLYTVAGGTQYAGNQSGVSIGQTATIPAGKVLSAINFGDTPVTNYGGKGNAQGTFAVYQWAGNYAETISRTPLYTIALNHSNNAQLNIEIPTSLMIEGSILWTFTPTTEVCINPWTANDQIAGTASYTNGVAKQGPWDGYIKCTLGLVANGENTSEHETSMFTGDPTYNFGYWDTTKQFGQKLTVPAGEKLTSVSTLWLINSGNTNVYNNKFTVYFYNWDTDFSTTAATAPVYSVDVVVGNNAWCTITIPDDVVITGDFMWYIKDAFGDKEKAATPSGAVGYVDGVLNLTNGIVANDGLHNGTTGWSSCNTIATKIVSEDLGVIYMNSVSKEVIYSGTLTFDEMPSKIRTEFRAKANAYANGAWGAWDGTFTHVGGGVYYTNHTFAETVTVNGVATELNDKNYVTVEANPVGFVGWVDNTGAFVSNSVAMKWFPKSADATLTAVYEGTIEAAVSANATVNGDKLTVVVTPTFTTSKVTEYGYYISVGTAIDTEALDGVTKVTANNAFAAYLQRVYDLKPATKGQTIYVVAYIVVDGVTTYGSTSVVA